MQEARGKIKRTAVLVLLICLAVAVPTSAQVSPNNNLTWHTIGGSGGQMQSTQYTLMGTLGQPFVGTMTMGSSSALCSGFWCGVFTEYRLYLPLVIR